VMPVIRGVFSQWVDTIDWTVRCDWLQVATVVICSLQFLTFNLYLASFMAVMGGVLECSDNLTGPTTVGGRRRMHGMPAPEPSGTAHYTGLA